MANPFQKKLVLITGSSSGIGKSTALDLASHGARLILVARREKLLQAVADEAGGEAVIFPCDLADRKAKYALIEKIMQDQGIPDIIINNAGYGNHQPFLQELPEELFRMMEVNYQAAAFLMSTFLPGMKERGSGAIVNVSSGAGKIALPHMATYCATKFALTALTEAVAYEMEGTGVTVHLVNPGPVETEFFRAGTWQGRIPKHKAKPEDVSRAIQEAILKNRRISYVPAKRGFMVYLFNLLGPFGRLVMRRKIRK